MRLEVKAPTYILNNPLDYDKEIQFIFVSFTIIIYTKEHLKIM